MNMQVTSTQIEEFAESYLEWLNEKILGRNISSTIAEDIINELSMQNTPPMFSGEIYDLTVAELLSTHTGFTIEDCKNIVSEVRDQAYKDYMWMGRPNPDGSIVHDKYELLTDDCISTDSGEVVYRIRAVKDFGNIKSGDLGGYVARYDNLSQFDLAWIADNAQCYGKAKILDDALLFGNAKANKNAIIFDEARVGDNAVISGNALINEQSCVFGNAHVSGDARVLDSAQVCGDAFVSGDVWITGETVMSCGRAVEYSSLFLKNNLI